MKGLASIASIASIATIASVLCCAARALADPAPAATAALTCAPLDDARNKKGLAAEHYRRGQELYAAGEYEASIAEFRAAYCLVPAPEAIFNIAQAYERLVDYERAVALFEAYTRALPPTSKEEIATVEHRIRALRRLPARIRVSTDPPGARIVLDGPGGKTEAMANATEPLRLSAGTYKMRIQLPGYLPIEEQLVAEIGQPYTYSYRLVHETGLLRVLTTPSDARILVDDRSAGVGSYVDRLPVGQHEIRVEASDRPTERRTVTLDAHDEERLFVAMKPARPPNGKIELLIGSTAIALVEGGLFGTAVTTNKPAAAAMTAVFGTAGFLVPYFLLPGEVPTGQSSLILGGRLWGALEAVSLAATLFPGQSFDEHADETSFMIVGTSVGFGIGAGFLARNLDISAGDAALVNSGAVWGTTLGVLAFFSFASSDSQAGGPIALGSLNAGLLIGAFLANHTELSRGHIFLIDLSTFAGLVSGTALSAVLGDTGDAARYALGGTALGLVVGTIVTRDIDTDSRVIPMPGFTTDARGRGVLTMGFSGTF